MRPAAALLILSLVPAIAQDVRGLEICTAEKDMTRRTSCLQSNVEFLQQELKKQARETRDQQAAAARDIAALKADVAALRAALDKTQGELAELKKSKPDAKPEKK
jgi:septal ring factor EnvC (AmiA/AmiB activator)